MFDILCGRIGGDSLRDVVVVGSPKTGKLAENRELGMGDRGSGIGDGG